MTSRLTWLVVALAFAALPSAASAHAQLEGTSPLRGAVVAKQPAQVMFRFDETVEGNFGAVRVYDGGGKRVDAGDAFHPDGIGKRMAVHLEPNLKPGTYTATYRVVSADGHIVSSGFAFSIGHAGATSQTVGSLVAGSSSGPVTATAFAAARALEFAAIGLGLGLFAFLTLVWPRASQPVLRRVRTLALIAVAAGLLAAVAGVVLEGADAAGISAFSAAKPSIVKETLGTRFGTYWGLAVPAWILAGAAALLRIRARVLVALPLAFLAALPALGGHAAAQDPSWLLVPANVAHVLAMGAWSGGLVALVVALPAGTRALEPAERTRLLGTVVGRFSAVALTSVLVLSATGALQGIVWVDAPRHLFDTAYGRAVLIKVVLLTVLVLVGVLNRRRTLPRLALAATRGESPGAAGVLLRRALRAEVALIVVVLGVTGALSGYPPSTTAASGPVSKTLKVGPASLELTVDPARPGANEVHLYLLDPKTGAQYDRAREIRVSAEQPAKQIGPLRETARRAGPGHYIVPSLVLGVPGTWQVTIQVRVSEFDEYVAKTEVKVR